MIAAPPIEATIGGDSALEAALDPALVGAVHIVDVVLAPAR